MPTYLDAQISQNSGSFGSPLIPVTSTPALFGTLGLITAGAGPNLRVQFKATVTIGGSLIAPIVVPSVIIEIVRGLGGPGVGTTVYRAVMPLFLITTPTSTEVITIVGSDFLPPNPGFLTYQAFVSLTIGPLNRVGPESFNALAASD